MFFLLFSSGKLKIFVLYYRAQQQSKLEVLQSLCTTERIRESTSTTNSTTSLPFVHCILISVHTIVSKYIWIYNIYLWTLSLYIIILDLWHIYMQQIAHNTRFHIRLVITKYNKKISVCTPLSTRLMTQKTHTFVALLKTYSFLTRICVLTKLIIIKTPLFVVLCVVSGSSALNRLICTFEFTLHTLFNYCTHSIRQEHKTQLRSLFSN